MHNFNSFDNDKSFDTFRLVKYLVIAGIVLLFFIYTSIAFIGIEKAKQTKGHFYLISVDDRNNNTTHMADSILSKTERCVEFRNEFGMVQYECGDRVSITTLK